MEIKLMQNFQVIFYRKRNGECPVEDFLLSLDKKMRAKIVKEISLLELEGNMLREPFSKHLEDGIFELRAKTGTNITRVLYFFYIGRKIVLTNGFVKKTQKTPISEIRIAKAYRSDYLQEQEEDKNERKKIQ